MAGGRAKTGNASCHLRKHLQEMEGLVDVWRAARVNKLHKRKAELKEMVVDNPFVKRVRVNVADLPRSVRHHMQSLMVGVLVAHNIAPGPLLSSPEWNEFVGGPDGLLPGLVSPARETYVQIIEEQHTALTT